MATKPPKTVVQACRHLRRYVRFETAALHLPGSNNSPLGNDKDTATIREATRVYIESWVVPVIDAMEAGDTELLKRLTKRGF